MSLSPVGVYCLFYGQDFSLYIVINMSYIEVMITPKVV